MAYHERKNDIKSKKIAPCLRNIARTTLAIAIFLSATLLHSIAAFSDFTAIDPKLIERTADAVDAHYLDIERADPKKMLLRSLSHLQKAVPEIMMEEKGSDAIVLKVGLAQKRFPIKKIMSMRDLKSTMNEIAQFLSANYKGEISSEDMESTLINGLLAPLDPHSNFLTKKTYDEFMIGTRGKFGGLGIVITVKDGQLTVIAPIEDTPAYRAGIRAGDRITQIEDESTINMSLTDAVNKLRGNVGSKVAIVVERDGKPAHKITLTRAVINIDSVKSGLLEKDGKRIGYLGIKNFQSNTTKDVKAALAKMHDKNAELDGLILDMRNNPGGLLSAATEIANIFLKEGVIVSTVGKDGEVLEKEEARGNGNKPDYPIAVLLNEGSASASEIVGGALQARGRATVMGNYSFGKGSVQTLFETGNGTALKLTIATYKPAGTESIQLEGVVPDIRLIPVVIDKEQINLFPDKFFTEEDFKEHLGNSKTSLEKNRKPDYVIRYLKAKEDEKILEEKSRKEYSKALDLSEDFEATLARNLIAAAGRPTRMETLKSCKDVIDAAAASEDEKIDAALKALGVNWSKTRAEGMPSIALSKRILLDDKPLESASSGQKIWLRLTATNRGTGNYSRLVGIGQSEDLAFLANKEFPFGHLKPGQSASWKVPIELPENLPSQNLKMELSFEEDNGNAPAKTEVIIPVKASPAPTFSMEYKISSTSYGKKFEANTPITMDVAVQNIGDGETSDEAILTLSGECSDKIFIEKGRVKMNKMPPGASERSKLKFHMMEGYPRKGCYMNLAITDIKKRAALVKRIELKADSGTSIPPPGTKLAAPKISVISAPDSTKEKNVDISATISDDNPIKDYFIFVGDKKILYQTNEEGLKEITFKTSVPLESGNNNIVIGARDDEKLMQTKMIVIEKK
ncbi:MAG TPA: MXAN_5808 family serine peptidase [bacterium]|nr:MAG: putative CtpA-like serine protease [bacterium ADurb.Bin270]HPW45497.1 MXAN_5808 family serine peptidase [bacterium]